MDLLERGRSLSELGRTLRWSDVKAMLIHLPGTSHVRRILDPEAARVAEWTTPTNTLLGALYDAWEAEALLRRGVKIHDLPSKGILARIVTPPDPEEAPRQSTRAAAEQRDAKAREVAAQIRAQASR